MEKVDRSEFPAKAGNQTGNQNGVKHNFYTEVLTEREKIILGEAGEIRGLEDELALLRVMLCHLLENNQNRIDLHLKVVGMIGRLARIHLRIIPEDREKLKEVTDNILREVVIPLGN